MTTFLAIGECMMELAPQAAEDTFRLGFAGDTFNTCWYLRQLAGSDVTVAYLSAIGDDAPSQRMAAFMANAGIDPRLTVLPGGTVGLYMISLSDDGERSFSYWRNSSAAKSLAGDLSALESLTNGDLAFLSGITLAILPDEGRAALLDGLRAARQRGVRVAFDPNLRPRLWPDGDTMCAAIMEAAQVCDIALPSYEDEADWFKDADPAATAARYVGAGASSVVVKNGGGPLLIHENGSDITVVPRPITNVVDTTAAGDSFNAGYFAGLLRGDDLNAAARLGCETAATVIGARGALVTL